MANLLPKILRTKVIIRSHVELADEVDDFLDEPFVGPIQHLTTTWVGGTTLVAVIVYEYLPYDYDPGNKLPKKNNYYEPPT
jgi:hypothetical protein